MRKRNFRALAVALALWPGLAEAANRWFLVESKYFRIYSDGSHQEVEQLALSLERFRRGVVQLCKLNPTQQPFTVVAFRDADVFARFRPYLGSGAVVLGYDFRAGVEEMAALALYDHGPAEREILFHECFHVLTEAGRNGWPTWLTEGAAEVFSTFEERGEKIVVGAAKGRYVKVLRERGLMSMDDLLTANVENHKQRIVFYPQSWALTHYLMFADHRARLDQLVEFTHLVQGGMDDVPAFQKAFHVKPADLETDLARYVRNEEYPEWEIPCASVGTNFALATSAVSEAERDCIFGNLVLSKGDLDRAEYYFKQALARDPELPASHEGLGFVAGVRHRFSEARESYERALAHGANNYRAYYFHAAALYLEHAGGRRFADSVPRETALAVVESVKKSIALRPSFPQNYELLARLSVNPGENPEEGMKLIKFALQFQPKNEWFLLTEARLLTRLHDYEAAHKTLEPLLGKDVRDDDLKKEVRAAQKELDALSKTPPKN